MNKNDRWIAGGIAFQMQEVDHVPIAQLSFAQVRSPAKKRQIHCRNVAALITKSPE